MPIVRLRQRQIIAATLLALTLVAGCSSGTEPLGDSTKSPADVTGKSTTSAAQDQSASSDLSTSSGSQSEQPSASASEQSTDSGSQPSQTGDEPITDPAILLPTPTGANSTGTVLVHLVDADRPDPLDPAGGPRELMVQLWYPAEQSDLPFAPYAPPAEAEALQQFYPVPAGAFTSDTNSRLAAPAVTGEHPVVFFHHGLCGARTDSTIVAEQLASSGYVVVALGNTREMPTVEFPGGRVVTTGDPAYCTAGADPYSPAGQEVLGKLLQVRVADVSFVADQLVTLSNPGGADADGIELPVGLGASMMLDKMGIYGHSFGGGTAAAVLANDDRFVAGIDLDGFLIGPVATEGLDKPFLVVGSSYHDQAFDPSWATFLPALRGWHQWIGVTTAGHYRFIDIGGSAAHWGLDTTLKTQDPATWTQVFGDISDETSQQINRELIVGFFDEFMRGDQSEILSDPAVSFPDLLDRTSEIK